MAEEEKPEDVEEKDAAPAAESTEETPAAEAAPEEAPAVSEEAAPAAPAEGAPAEGAPAEEGAEDKKEKEKPRTAEDIFLELEGAEGAETPKVLKAKGSKNISVGIVHVSA